MSKVYRASITFDIVPEENGLLHWQDEEDETPMTEEELVSYARDELAEAIYNGLKYDEVWNMIDVEIINA
jgi:hypothetical protein